MAPPRAAAAQAPPAAKLKAKGAAELLLPVAVVDARVDEPEVEGEVAVAAERVVPEEWDEVEAPVAEARVEVPVAVGVVWAALVSVASGVPEAVPEPANTSQHWLIKRQLTYHQRTIAAVEQGRPAALLQSIAVGGTAGQQSGNPCLSTRSSGRCYTRVSSGKK